MSKFKTEKYPRLVVRFSNRNKVRFYNGEAEVSGETADRLEQFAKTHPEYGIEVAEREERETPKQALQREARERGLDDSGTVKDLEARIAAHDEDYNAGDGDEGEALQREARERGLDDSGTVQDLEARIAAHDEGEPVGEGEDPEDDDDNE